MRVLARLLLITVCVTMSFRIYSQTDVGEYIQPSQDYKSRGRQISKFADSVVGNFKSEEFESSIQYIRDNNFTFPGGLDGLTWFYSLTRPAMHFTWKFHLEALDLWTRRYRKSPTSYIFRAANLISRGANSLQPVLHGDAKTTDFTPDKDLLKQARQALVDSKQISSKDPYWFVLMAEISIYLGDPQEKFMQIVNEGIKRYPNNFLLIIIASNYFLPNWYGSADAFEAYASKMASRPNAKDGKTMYARLYWHAAKAQYGVGLLKYSKVNRPRLLASTIALTELYPELENDNKSAFLFCLLGAKSRTRKMITKRNAIFDSANYWTNKDVFHLCRTWALSS